MPGCYISTWQMTPERRGACKIGRPKRNRSKNRAQRRARKASR